MNILKISRPVFWPVSAFAFLTGFLYADAKLSMISIIQLLMMTFPLSFITFGINDIYDYKTDKINKRKKGIDGSLLLKKDHKNVLKISIILSGLLIVCSIFTLNFTNIFSTCIILFLVYTYSMPHLRLKERPPLDSISNGLMALSVFLIGFSYNSSIFELDKKIILAAFCLTGMHAFTTIADYSADKRAGQKTFSVVFGKRFTSIVSLIIFVIAYLYGNFSSSIKYFLVFSCIIFGINFVKPSEKLAMLSSKIIFLFGILISIVFIYLNRY